MGSAIHFSFAVYFAVFNTADIWSADLWVSVVEKTLEVRSVDDCSAECSSDSVHTWLMHARNTNTYNRVRLCYHSLEHNHFTCSVSLKTSERHIPPIAETQTKKRLHRTRASRRKCKKPCECVSRI